MLLLPLVLPALHDRPSTHGGGRHWRRRTGHAAIGAGKSPLQRFQEDEIAGRYVGSSTKLSIKTVIVNANHLLARNFPSKRSLSRFSLIIYSLARPTRIDFKLEMTNTLS